MRAPAARSGGAAGVSHDSPRAQTCTFQGPGLQKHHQNSTRGRKKSEILGGPAEGGPKKGGPGKGGPGGTEHDQTKTLKPPHGNHETYTQTHNAHTNIHTNTLTHKHTQTHTNTHKHTQTQVEVGLAKVGLAKVGLVKFGQSRIWPKSVLAKFGHTTKTLTLAKLGLAKVGLAKVFHNRNTDSTLADHSLRRSPSRVEQGLARPINRILVKIPGFEYVQQQSLTVNLEFCKLQNVPLPTAHRVHKRSCALFSE